MTHKEGSVSTTLGVLGVLVGLVTPPDGAVSTTLDVFDVLVGLATPSDVSTTPDVFDVLVGNNIEWIYIIYVEPINTNINTNTKIRYHDVNTKFILFGWRSIATTTTRFGK